MDQREEFEDTKGVIRITKSTTERQYNGPARRDKRTNKNNHSYMFHIMPYMSIDIIHIYMIYSSHKTRKWKSVQSALIGEIVYKHQFNISVTLLCRNLE
jgi:hypothetical protein